VPAALCHRAPNRLCHRAPNRLCNNSLDDAIAAELGARRPTAHDCRYRGRIGRPGSGEIPGDQSDWGERMGRSKDGSHDPPARAGLGEVGGQPASTHVYGLAKLRLWARLGLWGRVATHVVLVLVIGIGDS
jgi:hypothetical protein